MMSDMFSESATSWARLSDALSERGSHFECLCEKLENKKVWKLNICLTCPTTLSQNLFWRIIHSIQKRIFDYYCDWYCKPFQLPMRKEIIANNNDGIMAQFTKHEKNELWRRCFELKYVKLLEIVLPKLKQLKKEWDDALRCLNGPQNDNQNNFSSLDIDLSSISVASIKVGKKHSNGNLRAVFQVMMKIGELYEDLMATQSQLLLK